MSVLRIESDFTGVPFPYTWTFRDNVCVGAPDNDLVRVTRDGVRIEDAFIMSVGEAASAGVVTLTSLPRRWWKRALVAVARWLLRRAG